MIESIRVDKWLWTVRIFKTRSQATEACKKGRVLIDGTPVKPSRNVETGDVVQVKKPPVTFSFRILALSKNRMGAKMVPQFMENITPPEEYEILELNRLSGFVNRRRGTGRPTKKERRELEQFTNQMQFEDFDALDLDTLNLDVLDFDSDS